MAHPRPDARGRVLPAGMGSAARILLENKYGCLPVVDGDHQLQGIVTEADFLRLTVQLLP